jgi:predicted metal-dependent phosphotriesterase family hydrolase
LIRTVLGDVSAERINQTMIHEHLIFQIPEKDQALEEGEELTEELVLAKDAGCSAIIEMSARGMGRNPTGLKRLSEKLGLHIVCSTGYYFEKFYPAEVFEMSRSEISTLFVEEITVGIEGGPVKAGIIAEIGTSFKAVTVTEDKVFRAACDAQKQTGVPISTHCELGTMGKAQVRIFQEEEMDLSRVSIGHQDLNTDFNEQLAILQTGAYLQFDTIGKEAYRPDADRLFNLLRLLDKGYEKQIMLSVDLTRTAYFRGNGGFGYVHLFDRFLPELREAGADETVIDTLMIHNPRRFLSIQEP